MSLTYSWEAFWNGWFHWQTDEAKQDLIEQMGLDFFVGLDKQNYEAVIRYAPDYFRGYIDSLRSNPAPFRDHPTHAQPPVRFTSQQLTRSLSRKT
jgi:hypothetical protein